MSLEGISCTLCARTEPSPAVSQTRG